MTLATIAIAASLTPNEEMTVTEWREHEGLIEVERTDANDVAIHLRHVNDTEATISAGTDRAGAVALAHALLAAAEDDS